MVLKIEKLETTTAITEGKVAAPTSESFVPPPSKKQKNDKDEAAAKEGERQFQPASQPAVLLFCAGCNISDREAAGALLLFDDPEEDENEKNSDEEKR